MRHTVRAIITKNKQILLVTGHDMAFYWLPGGTLEGDEEIIGALHREIKEELSVEISSYSLHRSYEFEDQKIDTFIVEIDGKITIDNEITGYAWYSSSSNLDVGYRFKSIMVPDLIKDGLIK